MKKSAAMVIVFGILFLFLIQTAGMLVESIYILDLLKRAMDEKALGMLFFFSPAVLLFVRRRPPPAMVWALFALLVLGRGLAPYLNTAGRMLASGVAAGAAFLLFSFLLTLPVKDERPFERGLEISVGLALAVLASIFLRTAYYSLDYSLQSEGGWIGWGLGIVLGFLLGRLEGLDAGETQKVSKAPTLPIIGVFLVIGLVYFAFAAPAVIARWVEGDYRLIVIMVSLLTAAWAGAALRRPAWIGHLPPSRLFAWNLLFTLALCATLLAHRVPFPAAPDSPPVVIGAPTWMQRVPLGGMLLLFPVVFFDLCILIERILHTRPTPRSLAPGMLLGSLALVLMVFMQIFTNVWGYVEPVSPWFRNKFWLPYLILSGLLALLVGSRSRPEVQKGAPRSDRLSAGWAFLLGTLVVGSAAAAFVTTRIKSFEPRGHSLVVMTYNLQQANDIFGERSYRQQLAWMERVAPDILALQESDSARVSLNNVDLVRYYAGKLGYYSYYGPSTVSGTFGTAILSRYPLQNPHSVFTFSDQDEIGIAVAEVEVGGRLFTVYNVHPDGSDAAMLAFARVLIDLAQGGENVIALGDYNLRPDEQAYRLISGVLHNAWEESGAGGASPPEENRIDHIFISPSLTVSSAVYVLPPDSATDHPLHWAEIRWRE